MARKTKRRRSPTAGRKRRSEPTGRPVLISFGAGEDCDCPICQAFGIDLDAEGGMDVRDLSPEDLAVLDAITRELKTERGGIPET